MKYGESVPCLGLLSILTFLVSGSFLESMLAYTQISVGTMDSRRGKRTASVTDCRAK